MLEATINGQKVKVPQGTTIMQAADQIGIHIHRLCYQPALSVEGRCRVCIVQVKGMNFYVTACSTKIEQGMEIETNSPELRQAKRDIVELLLDNHPKECQTCERDGHCELQNLAYDLGVRERYFEGKRKEYPLEDSSVSVVRDAEKCILCSRCIRVCAEVQGVNNLSQLNRGFNTVVAPAYMSNMDDSVCIQCGQCINACPTAAFQEKKHTEKVFKALSDPTMHVIVQTAPSIRAAIGEDFGLPPGTPCTGKMVNALRKIGFHAVFDTDFGADLTVMEEAYELEMRLKNKETLPLITSCSPGWINFLERFYPELIPHASTCMSPMSMTSSMIKTYYAKKHNLDPKKIFVVAIMPCVAKKFEIEREALKVDGLQLTDAVLTTREAAWMIKSYGIDFVNLPDEDFDSPLGESTGASVIFGTTGGVLEAALRTAVFKLTNKPLHNIEFKEIRAVEGLREKELHVGDMVLRVGVANGLINAKKLLNQVLHKKKEFHVIEIMACPGGCIGGGGQPYPQKGYTILDRKLFAKRAQALYQIDQNKPMRSSHENPSIQKIYKEFLKEPGSDIAHKYLHTHYHQQFPRGVR
jgi:iron-only hydrogenase group A